MDPLVNIADRMRAFFAEKSDEEIQRIWDKLEPEKYVDSISVSDYMAATQHLASDTADKDYVIMVYMQPAHAQIPVPTHRDASGRQIISLGSRAVTVFAVSASTTSKSEGM